MSAKGKKNQAYAFNIRTDEGLGSEVEREAKRRGESASFVFREAMREYLARRKDNETKEKR